MLRQRRLTPVPSRSVRADELKDASDDPQESERPVSEATTPSTAFQASLPLGSLRLAHLSAGRNGTPAVFDINHGHARFQTGARRSQANGRQRCRGSSISARVCQHMLPARHMPPVSSAMVGGVGFDLCHEVVLGFRNNRLLASLAGNGQRH